MEVKPMILAHASKSNIVNILYPVKVISLWYFSIFVIIPLYLRGATPYRGKKFCQLFSDLLLCYFTSYPDSEHIREYRMWRWWRNSPMWTICYQFGILQRLWHTLYCRLASNCHPLPHPKTREGFEQFSHQMLIVTAD